MKGADYLPWTGESPFDLTAPHNYRFRAGRVKPHLYDLSPFERTVYLDCDIAVLGSLAPVFARLDEWEMAVAYHPDPFRDCASQNIARLYNKPRAGWYHNRRERETTIREWGDGDIPYWNSGVLFWKRCKGCKAVFRAWAKEWMRFQQWDEQLSLMRAVYTHPLRVLVLPVGWNSPQRAEAKAIFHNYGKGIVRDNGTPEHVPSYIATPEQEFLRKCAAEVPAGGLIVEVGSLYGGTCVIMGKAAPACRIICVDDFSWSPIPEKPASAERLQHNLEAHDLGHATILEGDSRITGKDWTEPIDFLFIDGGHSYEYVLADISNFGPHARLIACHDYGNPSWPSIARAVGVFLKEYPAYYLAEVVGTLALLRRQE